MKSSDKPTQQKPTPKNNSLIYAVVIVVFFAILIQYTYYSTPTQTPEQTTKPKVENHQTIPKEKLRVFTPAELKEYSGLDADKPVYLSILGEVFDVSKGRKFYGKPDGSYSFFSGIDGTRAFVTGEFNEKGLISDVVGLTPTDMVAIKDWADFYHKDYKHIGVLAGHFYDLDGKPTSALMDAQQQINLGKEQKKSEEEEKKIFPGCNSKWSQEEGKKLWCSEKSGGIERNWKGVLRKMYAGTKHERCVCVQPESITEDDTRFSLYEGCDADKSECSWSSSEKENKTS